MKTVLVVTGPQGSGNHVFSKIFALHKDVYGWQDLLDNYWIPHFCEPFADQWNDPQLLKTFDWEKSNYYVTSISCPYVKLDNPFVPSIPQYKSFVDTLTELGITVKVAIIGRDQTILKSQQLRLRERHSLPDFEKELGYLETLDPIFLSTELLYLYKEIYVKSVGKLLEFPVNYNDTRLQEILLKDSNEKYIQDVDTQVLDDIVRKMQHKNS